MGGVYVHIPFCASKCPYCDFYSARATAFEKEEYVKAVLDEINTGRRTAEYVGGFCADTLYIGGGTPSLLAGEDIFNIVTAAKKRFNMPESAEITVECNPSSDIELLVPYFKASGVNRISLGMQSAVEKERKALGRMSNKARIEEVTALLIKNGIENISLDVMLGVPHQTIESLKETLLFAVNSGAKHISAYILKLEEGTYFYKNRHKYTFPDDDTVCDLYLEGCEFLRENGFSHYEISNFSKEGFESRHNTKYWLLEDYLGIGAAAHSFVGGKRFYFEPSREGFINGEKPVFDGTGGDSEEYIMLRLRLKKGLQISKTAALYGENAVKSIIKKAPLLKKNGLAEFDGENFSLTEKGFLVSNSVISELIE